MYSRKNAIDYAYYWWDKRNPAFYDFDDLGGDCTNFVSQCLYFGGIGMSYFSPGWFYDALDFRSPSWTGVEEFYTFSTQNNNLVGVRAKNVDISKMEVGDVVQISQNGNRFHHSMIITKILGEKSLENIFITCHTNNAKDRSLASYYFDNIRFLKILN